MPMICADTPTQMSPRRVSASWSICHSGSESMPLLTLSHSTTTVPLNFDASAGRRTSTLVLYGAVPEGWKVQRPSNGEPRLAAA